MSLEELLKKKLLEFDSNIQGVSISPKDIDFQEKICLLCFHCKNFNSKFTCPPRIPKLDYKNIICNEYENAMLVYTYMSFTESDYNEVRTASTVKIHKALLYLEKVLLDNNISTALSLIGGSCKLCKTGCPQDKCNNPYQSRIPMEATGINVVTTAKKVGINIKFPVTDSLHRCGLILW
jgi:predicted metal-binding protein